MSLDDRLCQRKAEPDGTFVVDEPNGQSVTVTTSSTTKVIKTVDAKLSDLQIGQPVAVRGTTQSNGTVAAAEIDQFMAGLPKGDFGRHFRFHGPGGPGGPRP